jgi:hypothetical protein
MNIIAFDPGQKGGIAIHHQGITTAHPMPLASTFTFGCGYGQLQGLLAGMGVPFELVTPQSWKKLVLAGTPKDKDAAIAYCRRTFPDVPLVMPRCRNPHDGIADSLCLLQYGLRQFDKYR